MERYSWLSISVLKSDTHEEREIAMVHTDAETAFVIRTVSG